MVIENGAAHRSIAGTASGPEYARNYLQKAFTWAKATGLLGIDWFILSDGTDPNDPFCQMGLYADLHGLNSPNEASATTSGQAYRTVSQALRGARIDSTASEQLALPSNSKGWVFVAGTQTFTAIWATADSGETATATVTVPCDPSCDVVFWDGQHTSDISLSTGMAQVNLTSSSVYLRSTAL